MAIDTNTKVLIVEDEIIVALDIQSVIEALDFEVTEIATDDIEVINSIEKNKPDIILMDINLENSQKNGIEISQYIQENYSLPVIFLTAFCDDETIKKAITTNPVGYLTKPFKRDELKSTILLAMYKMNTNTKVSTNSFDPVGEEYFYDTQNKLLYFKNKQLSLSQKERRLFHILFEKKGEVVSFETLEYKIWEDDIVSSSTLRTLIYRLRSKLDHKLIETISQSGCRLK